MEKIVTPLMEQLGDQLYRFPWERERKEDLQDIWSHCKMEQYVSGILNTYNQRGIWFPVSKQLTEPNTDVLVAVYNFGEGIFTLLDCLVESNGKLMWSTFNGATERVLAWRSLPEPFNPEKLEFPRVLSIKESSRHNLMRILSAEV